MRALPSTFHTFSCLPSSLSPLTLVVVHARGMPPRRHNNLLIIINTKALSTTSGDQSDLSRKQKSEIKEFSGEKMPNITQFQKLLTFFMGLL